MDSLNHIENCMSLVDYFISELSEEILSEPRSELSAKGRKRALEIIEAMNEASETIQAGINELDHIS